MLWRPDLGVGCDDAEQWKGRRELNCWEDVRKEWGAE